MSPPPFGIPAELWDPLPPDLQLSIYLAMCLGQKWDAVVEALADLLMSDLVSHVDLGAKS